MVIKVVSGLGAGGRRGGRLDLSPTNAPDDQSVLAFEHAFQLVVTVIRGVQEVLVGSCYGMDDSPADVNHGFDAGILFSRLGLDVVNHALVLDVCIESSHHISTPREGGSLQPKPEC